MARRFSRRIPKRLHPKPPLAASLILQKAYAALLARMLAWVEANIVRQWHTNAHASGPRHPDNPFPREDAAPWIEAKLRLLRAEFEGEIGDVVPSIDLVADRVNRKAGKDLRAMVGIKLNDHPGTGLQAQADFRQENLDKITSLASDQIDELRDLLQEATEDGWRVEDLSDYIQDRFDVTTNKADLLARDQTLKLNAQITQERQTQAGISEYTWSTSGDERVRETHAELDGDTFSWDDPPITNEDGDRNHPGEDYQCRCIAIPVLPPLDSLDTVESDDEG